MPAHASPDPARRATIVGATPPHDLAADDLAGLALELSRAHGTLDVLRVAADGLARLVPEAAQVVVSTLGQDGVELSAATGSGAASLEAWQHAVRTGPAARAAEQPGTEVVVDDLGHDPRWPDLHTVARREGLLSVLSVAALLPTSRPTGLPATWGSSWSAATAPAVGRSARPTRSGRPCSASPTSPPSCRGPAPASRPAARTDDEHPAGHGGDVPRSR